MYITKIHHLALVQALGNIYKVLVLFMLLVNTAVFAERSQLRTLPLIHTTLERSLRCHSSIIKYGEQVSPSEADDYCGFHDGS
jgi:hypothetical protein